MSEWKPIGSAPKDSRVLGWCSIHKTQVVAWFEPLYNKWVSHLSNIDHDEDEDIPSSIIYWVKIPESPMKNHCCEGLSYKVIINEQGNLAMRSYNQNGIAMFFLCNFCPVCGEKA